MKEEIDIELRDTKDLDFKKVLKLYKANEWSSADKPENLMNALKNSYAVLTAWDDDKLVGLGNAISDGHLVVYYPHLLVLPEYKGKGIGKMIMEEFVFRFGHMHQQILVADEKAVGFYKKCGFVKAGNTQSMWIYDGDDH